MELYGLYRFAEKTVKKDAVRCAAVNTAKAGWWTAKAGAKVFVTPVAWLAAGIAGAVSDRCYQGLYTPLAGSRSSRNDTVGRGTPSSRGSDGSYHSQVSYYRRSSGSDTVGRDTPSSRGSDGSYHSQDYHGGLVIPPARFPGFRWDWTLHQWPQRPTWRPLRKVVAPDTFDPNKVQGMTASTQGALADESKWWVQKSLTMADSVLDDLLNKQETDANGNQAYVYPQWRARLMDENGAYREGETKRVLQVTMTIMDKERHRELEQQRIFFALEKYKKLMEKYISDLFNFRQSSLGKVYLDLANMLLGRLMGNLMDTDPPGGRANPSL